MTTAYGLVVTQVRRTSKTSNLRNHKPNLDNMLQVSGYFTRPQTSTRTTPGRQAGGCGETVTASMSPTASRAGSLASGTYTNLFLLLPFYHSFIQLNIPAVLLLRYSGAPDDWKYDTINFYSDPVFTGLDKRKTENEIVDKTCDASGPSYTPTTQSPILVTLTTEPGH